MNVINYCPNCKSKKIIKSPSVVMPFISYRLYGWIPLEIDPKKKLRTLNNGTSYLLCSTAFCEKCTLIFCDLRFNALEMSKLYKNYRGIEYTKQRSLFESDYGNRNKALGVKLNYIKKIENFINLDLKKPKTILDWGSDNGMNTPFQNSNSKIYLYDISKKKTQSKKKNFTVVSKLTKSIKFDLIIAMHVFEHLSYPLKSLISLRNCLKKKGLIYIEVPLEEKASFERSNKTNALKKYYWHEHINFFSKLSFECLFKTAGFKILSLQKIRVNTGGKKLNLIQVLGTKND